MRYGRLGLRRRNRGDPVRLDLLLGGLLLRGPLGGFFRGALLSGALRSLPGGLLFCLLHGQFRGTLRSIFCGLCLQRSPLRGQLLSGVFRSQPGGLQLRFLYGPLHGQLLSGLLRGLFRGLELRLLGCPLCFFLRGLLGSKLRGQASALSCCLFSCLARCLFRSLTGCLSCCLTRRFFRGLARCQLCCLPG